MPVGGKLSLTGLRDDTPNHIGHHGAAGAEGAGGTRSPAAVPVGGGRARAGIMATRRTTRQHARRHWCGGRRRVRRAREGPAAVPVGGGRAWPSIMATRRTTRQHARRRRCGGRRRDQEPGRGARGRWQGQGGHHGDAPGEARGADGSRAGRRPRAHQAARPSRRPEHPWGHSNRRRANAPRHTKTDIRIGCRPAVELGGFEPPTFSLRTRRATNCAIAPKDSSSLAPWPAPTQADHRRVRESTKPQARRSSTGRQELQQRPALA